MEIRDRSLDTLLSLMLRVSSLVLQLGLATELKKVSIGWRRQISDGHGAFSSQGRIDDLLGHGPSVPPVSPVFVLLWRDTSQGMCRGKPLGKTMRAMPGQGMLRWDYGGLLMLLDMFVQ